MDRLPAPGHRSDELVPSSQGTAISEFQQLEGLQEVPERGGANQAIARILAAILRYKWLVLLIVALGITGSVVATKFIDPVYRTGATVYLEGGGGKNGPIQPGALLQESSWIQLMRSFAVLDPVVRGTRLYIEAASEDSVAFHGFDLAKRFLPGSYRLKIDPSGRRYTLHSKQGLDIESGAVGDSIGTKMGWLWAPPASALGKDRAIEFTIRTPREASQEINQALKTSLPEDGRFLTVTLQ